ncbi:amidohydrolase [Domibacillus sp. 8LH]|uniref:amidohydrolase n=1 Tax=Domibacillus sp. 8LH TaxID=3073900 RepID=UPI00317EEECB
MTLEKDLIQIRRHLHQFPELSEKEFETTKFIASQLLKRGIKVRPTVLETGVFADIEGTHPGPTIAIRADIDALPIQEQTNLPYRSRIPGKMHACGHDFHTAAVLGAAYLLKAEQAELRGKIRLIFQPAEEYGAGAQKVLRDGQLKDVDAIIGLHNKPDLPVGTIGIKSGPLMAAVDRFKVVIKGKGAHAALPQNGHDPITASAQLITALQTIVSRSISPLESAVVSVTRIEGGNTWNVLPETVTVEGTIRTFDPEIRTQVKERFYAITEQITGAFSSEAAIDWFEGPPSLINHAAVAEAAWVAAERYGLKVMEPELSTAGEDFAYYLQHTPGVFAFFGTNGDEDWHHPSFTVDETALIEAAYFLYHSAKELLLQQTVLTEISG